MCVHNFQECNIYIFRSNGKSGEAFPRQFFGIQLCSDRQHTLPLYHLEMLRLINDLHTTKSKFILKTPRETFINVNLNILAIQTFN
jgi:hypothetical protein